MAPLSPDKKHGNASPEAKRASYRNNNSHHDDFHANHKKKKSALMKSASEASIKREKKLTKPDTHENIMEQELLVLERDEGRRHARELSTCLLEYAKKIEQVQAKNRRLEEELSFDDHLARDDPFFNDQVADKLSNLYLQGNNFMIRLELERKEVMRMNRLIQQHEARLAQQKAKLYELAAVDHNHQLLINRIRKMESELDRRMMKLNEKLHQNRKLRQQIDAHRSERARMDSIFTKIASETFTKKHKVDKLTIEVDKLRQEVAQVEDEIEKIRQEGEVWEHKCDQKASGFLQELKAIALHQKGGDLSLVDADKYKYLGENDLMRTMSLNQENLLRSRVSRSRWKTGQAKIATDVLLTKYQENRTFIEKIHEVSGTKTVLEMIEAFNNQETEHFERIQHVNQLAEDIENHRQISAKLREEIGRLKQRKDSVDFQRMNRIEALKSRLQFTIDQKKHKEEANHELQGFLAALKPAILLLHSRIGCPELHSMLILVPKLQNAQFCVIDDSDMKKVLGEIENQVVTILQKFHTKLEAKRKEEELAEEEAKDNGTSTTTAVPHIPSPISKSTAAPPTRTGSAAPSPTRHRSSSQRARAGGSFDSTTSPSSDPSTPCTDAPATPATPTSTLNFTLGVPVIDFTFGGLGASAAANAVEGKGQTIKTIAAMVSKEQPYRYSGLRPPHLSLDELKKKDNVEEEYPLTYDELKVKVWCADNNSLHQ